MSALHDFDVQLCEGVRYNVSRHFDDAAFAKAVTAPLPPGLASYLLEGTRHDAEDPR
jgi:hypothetical protein